MLWQFARFGDQRSAAAVMGISLSTAKSYLTRAYAKLNVTNCIDAFRVLGWLHVPEVAA
jgi:DNA-binding CsgD family transcriptional regulator